MQAKSWTTKTILVLVTVVLFGAAAFGQESADKPQVPSIHVSSEGVITAKPDQAEIDIGVITQAQTAQSAAARNAAQLTAALGELRKVVPQETDFKTISYSVSPNYRYPSDGGKPTIVGYTASNIVRVLVNDLSLVGKVIDAATQSGANTIHRLQFKIRDERAVQAQALRDAALRARSQAEALAEALGLRIVKVLSVRESEPVTRPFRDAMMTARAESAAVPTPIDSGMIEVRATITLTVEVSPK